VIFEHVLESRLAGCREECTRNAHVDICIGESNVLNARTTCLS
jgi:hypothetical protein